MLYQTIVLELLESHPGLYTRLRIRRALPAELNRYANDLRTIHLRLKSEETGEDAARELAVAEIESRIAEEAERLEA
jgi:hypothetical protein